MARRILFLIMSLIVIPISITAADSGYFVWQGFETDNGGWNVDDWANNMLSSPALANDFASEGKQSLEVKCSAASSKSEGMVQVFDLGDLTAVDSIKFDVYNSTLTDMTVQLMIKTGANWLLQYTKPTAIKPGWNRDLTIDFNNGWQVNGNGPFSNTVTAKTDVRRFGFYFKPSGAADGFIAIDNIRIAGGAAIKNLIPEKDPEGLKVVTVDHFEKGANKWSAAAGWSCATGVEIVKDADGQGVMKAKFNMTKPGTNAAFVTEGNFDLSDVYYIDMDIYNPNDFSMNATVAFGTGVKWSWQEGPSIKVKKGWNRNVRIPLKKKVWKNEESKWASNTTPAAIDQVKRITLLLFPPDMGEGYALIDNIKMETTDPGKLDNLVPIDLGRLSYRVWNSFEKGINWAPSTGDSGAVAVNPVSNFGGESNRGMELKFSLQNNIDKAAYSIKENIDFSDAAGVKFDVYNPNAYGLKISIAFKTGDDQVWIESKQVGIAPGWNKGILFDFITPSFKSAASNWNFTDYFSNRNDIREFIIQVYPDAKVAGSLDFSDFKLGRRNFMGDLGDLLGFTFANNSKMTVEPIIYKQWDDGAAEGTFENAAALNFWKYDSAEMAAWGPTNISISDKYASKGKKSLKIDYKDAGTKFAVEYTTGVNFDIRGKDAICFDIYNPGKLLKLAVAFKAGNTAGSWYETKQININPGWNKNISIDLNAANFKDADSGWQNTDTLKNKDIMSKIFFMFYNGIEGAVYLDNVRWGYRDTAKFGKDSAGNINTGNDITDLDVEQDLNVYFTPSDNIEGKATLRAAYYNGQNNELSVQSAHVIVRGLGNEFTAFAGEDVKPYDDIVGLINPLSIGSNTMGLKLAGTVYPINTTYMLMGMSLDSDSPWSLGTTYAYGARVKTYFLDKDFIGAIFMNTRRGYDRGANPLTGEVEESANVYGGDALIYLPWKDVLDLNLTGEMLASQYATNTPVYWMSIYPLKEISVDLSGGNNLLMYGQADLHFGYLTLTGYYRSIGANFASSYINPDYGYDDLEYDAKATYIMDNVFPFNIIGNISDGFATFVHNTQLMVEYGVNHKISADTYKRDTYTIDLKNDESLALYNYHIWAKFNDEGDPSQNGVFPDNSVSAATKILAGDLLTFRLLGRLEALHGPIFESGAYLTKDYLRTTGFIESSLKLSKKITLTGNYKIMSTDGALHSNWYSQLEANFLGAFNIIASFGAQPFTGYWLDNNNDDTITRFSLAFKGYF